MYISLNINKVLYILPLLSITMVYTSACALKSRMNTYQGGQN